MLAVPYTGAAPPDKPAIQLLYQDYARLGIGVTCMGSGPMTVGTKQYRHGLGVHANSRIRIHSPEPIAKFTARIGAENNSITNPVGSPTGSVIFAVISGDKDLYRSPVMWAGKEAEEIEVDTRGARTIDLLVTDGGNGPACDWADWADAAITLASGKTVLTDEIGQGYVPVGATRYPFSFLYGGKPSDAIEVKTRIPP